MSIKSDKLSRGTSNHRLEILMKTIEESIAEVGLFTEEVEDLISSKSKKMGGSPASTEKILGHLSLLHKDLLCKFNTEVGQIKVEMKELTAYAYKQLINIS